MDHKSVIQLVESTFQSYRSLELWHLKCGNGDCRRNSLVETNRKLLCFSLSCATQKSSSASRSSWSKAFFALRDQLRAQQVETRRRSSRDPPTLPT